jgi:hypothetical protein
MFRSQEIQTRNGSVLMTAVARLVQRNWMINK